MTIQEFGPKSLEDVKLRLIDPERVKKIKSVLLLLLFKTRNGRKL